MSPLPANNTWRLWIDYTSMGVEHTMLLRYNQAMDGNSGLAQYNWVTSLLSEYMRTADAFVGARFSAPQTTFSLPLDVPTVEGTSVVGTRGDDPESVFYSVVGRGNLGRRVRYEFFTPLNLAAWPDNNRYESGEVAVMTTFLADFKTALDGGLDVAGVVDISGAAPTLYNYLNIAHNAYWTRRQRRSNG